MNSVLSEFKKRSNSFDANCRQWSRDSVWACAIARSARGVVWFGFYGISTLVGYFMPNPLYTYVLNI